MNSARKLGKRIVSIVIVLCFTVWSLNGVCQNVWANTENDAKANIEILLTELVHTFYPYAEPEIEDIIPIYDEEWDICEYALDILCDEREYGYVIVENRTMNITEFKIEENSDGFYETYFEKIREEDKVVKRIDALNFELVDVADTGFHYVADKDDLFDIFLDGIPEPVYSNYYMRKERYIPRHCAFGQGYIEDILGMDYCCAVTAMLNVCGGYNFYNKKDINNIKWAYGTLWSMAQVRKLNDGYVANQECMGAVVSQFAKWYAGKDIPYTRKENPGVSFFVDAVDNKYSSILGVTSYYTNESGKKMMSGHAVSVEGYLKFEPIVYGTEKYYLYVATGWGNKEDTKYILYNDLNVISTYGVSFQYMYK